MISIVPYDPLYKQDFINLNIAWLEKYFVVEEHDLHVFTHIEDYILKDGGQIFFALKDGVVCGTVGMYKDSNDFELCKMAVDPKYQGLGIAHLLMKACIDFAILNKARSIYLFSNTKLTPAINLYYKSGFVKVPVGDTQYARTDIKMEMILDCNSKI